SGEVDSYIVNAMRRPRSHASISSRNVPKPITSTWRLAPTPPVAPERHTERRIIGNHSDGSVNSSNTASGVASSSNVDENRNGAVSKSARLIGVMLRMAIPFARPASRPRPRLPLLSERVETLLEPTGVRALGAGQGLEPLGDLGEAFLARRLGEARVHRR